MPLPPHQENSTLARHQENSKLNSNCKSVDCRGHLGRILVIASRWTEASQGDWMLANFRSQWETGLGVTALKMGKVGGSTTERRRGVMWCYCPLSPSSPVTRVLR